MVSHVIYLRRSYGADTNDSGIWWGK
jgi:diguanylate cyclase (GGDEF)-like protein